MGKVLITGITGFVGSHLADLCLNKHVNLYGFRRYHLSNLKNIVHIEDKIRWVDCDMMDAKAVTKAIQKVKPDVIFHMASQSFVSPSWDHPSLYMDANYRMTVNLFEACLESRINPRIHIPGSGEEYGEIYEDELPITLTTQLRPVNPYAVSKVAQDMIAYVYFRSYGLRVIRTRAFNHEGPRRDRVFGIPWYCYQIAKIEHRLQKPVIKVGYVDDLRNFTHIKDMVRAYWLAVEKCKPGELYLIGSEADSHVHTFRECVEMLIEMSKVKNIRYKIDPQYVRPTQVPRLICDTSAFVKTTGWKPRIDFETILVETLNYWRDQIGRGLVK
ncbi:MAG: GDP-mannose 4,6-dehydratase [Acidobacteria bacterium]|nr:MAG: GDP-mannose 4,6-dehydratase [Acidobacteriota bacterium]